MKKYSQYGRIKKFFHEYDLFRSPANLRFREQPDVSQYCSGVFSMLLIAFFFYILLNQLLKITRFESIESSQFSETQLNLSAPSASGIKFSFTPGWLSKATWETMFTVTTTLVSSSNFSANQFKTVQVKPCQQQDWANLSTIFTDLEFGQNICPVNPADILINGASFMANQTYLSISIYKCDKAANLNCKNQSEFNQFLKSMYPGQENYMSFYIVDTNINAQNINPIQEIVRSNYDFAYTSEDYVRADLYLGTYIVQTDSSTWPLSDATDQLTGYYVQTVQVYSLQKNIPRQIFGYDIYGQINVYMGNRRKKFSRKIGKIDTVVSYAGGLFGILIGIFAYILNSSQEYSYELRMAESSFNYDEHGNKVKEKHYNFFRYAQYSAFDWMNFMFCYELPIQYCKKTDQTRQQANLTMDVIHLFRKIQLIELVLQYQLNPNQLTLQNLTRPPKLEEVKNKRYCMEYYNKVIRGKFAINIEDFKKNTTSLAQYRKMVDKMRSKNKSKNKNAKLSPQQQQKRARFRSKASIQTQKVLGTDKYLQNIQNMDIEIQQQLGQNHFQLRKEIIQKFTFYSDIKDKKLIQDIAQFTELAQQARTTELDPNMLQVEEQFADAYVGLIPEIKDRIIDRIPLKILHRIINCIERKSNPVNNLVKNFAFGNGNGSINENASSNGNGNGNNGQLLKGVSWNTNLQSSTDYLYPNAL